MGRAELGSASQAPAPGSSRGPPQPPSHQVPSWDTVRPCPTFWTTALAGKSRARLQLTSARKDSHFPSTHSVLSTTRFPMGPFNLFFFPGEASQFHRNGNQLRDGQGLAQGHQE